LVFAGVMGLTGLGERMRFGGWMAWVAGALSGFFGGLVGNQGGMRSAGLVGYDVPEQALVATATAVALLVGGARQPVYVDTPWPDRGKRSRRRGRIWSWPRSVSLWGRSRAGGCCGGCPRECSSGWWRGLCWCWEW